MLFSGQDLFSFVGNFRTLDASESTPLNPIGITLDRLVKWVYRVKSWYWYYYVLETYPDDETYEIEAEATLEPYLSTSFASPALVKITNEIQLPCLDGIRLLGSSPEHGGEDVPSFFDSDYAGERLLKKTDGLYYPTFATFASASSSENSFTIDEDRITLADIDMPTPFGGGNYRQLIYVEPKEYWEWRNPDGTNPKWDKDTGAWIGG